MSHLETFVRFVPLEEFQSSEALEQSTRVTWLVISFCSTSAFIFYIDHFAFNAHAVGWSLWRLLAVKSIIFWVSLNRLCIFCYYRGSQNSKAKSGHLRSNLRFRPKNSFLMTHSTMSHKNLRTYVIWRNKKQSCCQMSS